MHVLISNSECSVEEVPDRVLSNDFNMTDQRTCSSIKFSVSWKPQNVVSELQSMHAQQYIEYCHLN